MSAGDDATERRYRALQRRINREYKQAQEELTEKLHEFTAKYEKQDQAKRKQLAEGKITEQQYRNWVKGQVFQGKRWQERVDQVARQLTQVDETATAIVNGTRLGVFADNANFQNSEAEKAVGVRFDLYDSATVARLLDEQPNLLPPRKVKRSTDIPWYHKQVANAVTQGILQGESIDKLAKRIGEQTGETSRKAMLRNARTAMTSAQNAGRMEAMHQQHGMGIRVQKKWIAAHDSRTRKAHQQLDGQTVDVDEPFKSILGVILFPGDPAARPENVYNCRCALGYVYPKYQPEIERGTEEEILAEERENREQTQGVVVPEFVPVQGHDISATWHRRADEFGFEIEDAMNAQGFDGLPRVVSPEEFDEFVKQANGGEGFIAQRSYTAPDQETLDAYRKMLYEGKWYVDCSTGGAQYGQGMYCAADYTGELSDGITEEMQHYTKLGQSRLRGEAREIARKKVWQEALSDADSDLERAFVKDLLNEASAEERRMLRHTTDEQDDYLSNKFNKWFIKANKAQDIEAVSYIETLTLDRSTKIIEYGELVEKRIKFHDDFVAKDTDKVIADQLSLAGLQDNKDAVTFMRFQLGYGDVDWDTASAARAKLTKEQIFDISALQPQTHDAVSKSRADLETEYSKKYQSLDIGALATLWGYDAINSGGHGRSGSYTVVLNRTKLIIRRPDND